MQRYNKLYEQFVQSGIEIVVISVDNVTEAERMKRKLSIPFPVLTDEDLTVTDLYKIRFQNGLTTKRKMVRPVPVPMKILIDGEGIVRWQETSDDYRVRISPDQILQKAQGLVA